MKKENENRGSYDSPKWGKHPKETRKTHCVMVRFDDEEWLKFLSMSTNRVSMPERFSSRPVSSRSLSV